MVRSRRGATGSRAGAQQDRAPARGNLRRVLCGDQMVVI